MDPLELSAEFTRLYQAVYARFHRRDAPKAYRISQESHGVLRHLHDSGPLTVMEAAAHFERSQSTMSELITRLEQRGLLERMTDQRDRRRTLVWLTPQGRETLVASEQVLSKALLEHAFDQLESQAAGDALLALQLLLSTPKHPTGFKDDEHKLP